MFDHEGGARGTDVRELACMGNRGGRAFARSRDVAAMGKEALGGGRQEKDRTCARGACLLRSVLGQRRAQPRRTIRLCDYERAEQRVTSAELEPNDARRAVGRS